jgi:phosphatidylglycerophosphate synthase
VEGFALPSFVPVVAIGKDLLTVLGFTLVYLITGQSVIQPRVLGKACTLIQLLLVAYTLAAPDLPEFMQRWFLPLAWAATGLAALAAIDYLVFGNRIAAAQHERSRKANN